MRALTVLFVAGCSSGPALPVAGDVDAADVLPKDAGADRRAQDASKGRSEDAASDKRDAGAGGDSADTLPALDAGLDAATGGDATVDGGADGACSVEGLAGECMTVTACAALTGHTSTAGYCPGPASIECCTDTPSTADNPPTPAGYVLMQQSQVTAAMTAWAVAILDDPTTYPMFSTTLKVFGTQTVLARVEWHPPDFQNSVVHRGVTLYVPS
jgi:hypothetical protein